MPGTFPGRLRPIITDANAPVIVYGTQWCAETQKVRRYLDRMRVPYIYRDMDRDPEATRRVQAWTGGYASHPTLDVGGQILVEPSLEEVQQVLASTGLI